MDLEKQYKNKILDIDAHNTACATQEIISRASYHQFPDTDVVVCLLELKNGLVSVGQYIRQKGGMDFSYGMACDFAYQDARSKIYPMVYFHLKTCKDDKK